LLLSVLLFVVIPLGRGVITRSTTIKHKGETHFLKCFIPKFGNVTIIGLLLTLIIIFALQGKAILENPVHILLIAIPLTIRTYPKNQSKNQKCAV